MTQSSRPTVSDDLCVRLRSRKAGWESNISYAPSAGGLINPDGPEAARVIESLLATVTALKATVGKAEGVATAAQAILGRMTSTFTARNGREVGIQGDDGEKCWIVHSDDIEALRAALTRSSDGPEAREEYRSCDAELQDQMIVRRTNCLNRARRAMLRTGGRGDN